MSEPFIGEIRIFGFNFAPRGWALCNGQILAIAQNQALFALLGTTYGGNGTTTFALPNLQSRVPVHQGQGAGLSNYYIGQMSGTETVTLIASEMPIHNHVVGAASAPTSKSPSGAVPAFTTAGSIYGTTVDSQMKADMVGTAGGSQPHNNIQPYLTVNFCIALEGIFPSRN